MFAVCGVALASAASSGGWHFAKRRGASGGGELATFGKFAGCWPERYATGGRLAGKVSMVNVNKINGLG
jgi:hypothetical protein